MVAFVLSARGAFAYSGVYLVLVLAHLLGFVSSSVLTIFALPILVAWVMSVVRWIVTGSPTPRRWQRD
jgi:hypothetical protein